ncbi:hypothetical protein [Lacihabitans soyangensis]|nr:hypothetical protein [Lacihabitans soyangensis]
MNQFEATYELSNEMMLLVELIIKKLRDETFQSYITEREKLAFFNKDEDFKKTKNRSINSDLNKLEEDKSNLFSNLSSQELKLLDKLVLNVIDNLLFNLLREFDEVNTNNWSLHIESKNIETLRNELIGNGNFTGDFFTWASRFSKFGDIEF